MNPTMMIPPNSKLRPSTLLHKKLELKGIPASETHSYRTILPMGEAVRDRLTT